MPIFGQPVPSTGDPAAASPPAESTAPASEGAPASPPVDTPSAPPAGPAPAPAAQYVDTEAMGGHLVKVQVNGAEVEMPLKDALQGVMRHQDYTRKTQEIADARRKLHQADALAAALEADPVGTIKQLSDVYQIDPANGFEPQEPDPVRDQLRSQEAQLAEIRMNHAQQQINAEVQNLRAQYGNFDERAVAEYAIDNRMTLTNAYKAMNFDAVRTQGQQPPTAEQNRQRALAAQNMEGGSNAQPGSVTKDKKPAQSFREAYFQAKAEHGV